VPRISLAHDRALITADAPGGGDRIETLVAQVFVELRGRLLGVGVVAFVSNHVITRNREACDTRRIHSVESGHGLSARRPHGLKRHDAARVARERPCVAAVADTEPQTDAFVGGQREARRLDPELMRHRRRRPRGERAGGEGGDGVARAEHQGAESLLLFVPECGVARYGKTR
jgi:hypothetical protein